MDEFSSKMVSEIFQKFANKGRPVRLKGEGV